MVRERLPLVLVAALAIALGALLLACGARPGRPPGPAPEYEERSEPWPPSGAAPASDGGPSPADAGKPPA